jgi:hypothetical protein
VAFAREPADCLCYYGQPQTCCGTPTPHQTILHPLHHPATLHPDGVELPETALRAYDSYHSSLRYESVHTPTARRNAGFFMPAARLGTGLKESEGFEPLTSQLRKLMPTQLGDECVIVSCAGTCPA